MASFTQGFVSPSAGRIHQIDILRGVAALAVVFAHWHFYATKLYATELRTRPAQGKTWPPASWLLLLVLFLAINRFARYEYTWILVGPLASVLCSGLLLNIERLFRVPNPLTAALDWIGTRSYSLYVVHWPALAFSFAALAYVEAPVIWLRLGLPFLLSAVLMLILYHLVEVPSLELGKKLARRV